jgi:uncharacterized protein (UPF0332 family)
MKEINFLKKLKREGKFELVEPSEEIKSSYLIKAENCFKSAKILFQNQLYENSVSEAYYCMYSSLLALLFKVGIKSENHSASVILFKTLFNESDLGKIISWAKDERIDKQYYIETKQIIKATKESCNEMILKAETFLIKMKRLISELSNEEVAFIRETFNKLFP